MYLFKFASGPSFLLNCYLVGNVLIRQSISDGLEYFLLHVNAFGVQISDFPSLPKFLDSRGLRLESLSGGYILFRGEDSAEQRDLHEDTKSASDTRRFWQIVKLETGVLNGPQCDCSELDKFVKFEKPLLHEEPDFEEASNIVFMDEFLRDLFRDPQLKPMLMARMGFSAPANCRAPSSNSFLGGALRC